MNPEELELYKRLIGKGYAEVEFNYQNPKLEELMSDRKLWKQIKEKLTASERKTLTAYKNYKNSPEWGLALCHVKALAEVTTKLTGLYNAEINARWVVQDQQSGLYWANIITPPYWRSSRVAFLFISEAKANYWVNGFIKASGRFDFRARKIDATKRFEKWDKRLRRNSPEPD
ncbi:hypothetical protein [Coleofasciculus sp. FACHB-501]|uniref:hypothetical protein n=1 Tax=Cyanophyceae TaxID=3028117 RepID=UPI00168530CC|nr:hypothetical protein [Coleofasciculus sp. FACHB-501]MBD1836662.1 hypothetical protein [Coleofasciculus sp. FACHB-501]